MMDTAIKSKADFEKVNRKVHQTGVSKTRKQMDIIISIMIATRSSFLPESPSQNAESALQQYKGYLSTEQSSSDDSALAIKRRMWIFEERMAIPLGQCATIPYLITLKW